MTLSVNFNVAAMLTHHNLQVVDRSLAQTLQQLSSGLRISRAADDPAAMTLANIMRHHLAGLDQATSNSEEGVSMVQTAEGAMGELSNTLASMRALAINAANAAAHNPDSLAALQAQLDSAVASITSLATNTRFGSRALLQGNLADDRLSDVAKASFTAMTQDATKLPGGIKEGSTLTTTIAPVGMTLDRSRVQVSLTTDGVTPAAVGATLQGLIQNGTALSAVDGKTIVITGPNGSQTLTLAAGATINDFLAQVNAYTAKTGARAAYDATTGVLTVESTAFGNGSLSVASADMTGTTVGLLDSDTTNPAVNAFDIPAANRTLTLQYTDAGGTTRSVTLTQDPTSPGGLTFTNLAGGPEAAAPFTAFAPGAFQVTLKDTSGGALSSSVTVAGGAYTATRQGTTFIQTGALAGQQVALDIPDLRAAALGHGAGLAAAGFASLQDLTDSAALTSGNADSALKVIDAAIQEVSAARGRAGAIQADALESGLNSLRVSFENLTAAESQLRDVDFAAASAAYARDNIIYQAATAMLAQANQVPQTILDLLKR